MDYDDLMKPFAARLVDDLEVDVNVYPPGSGGGGPPGRSFLDLDDLGFLVSDMPLVQRR